MDDSMDSVATVEEGVQLYGQLDKLWKAGGMRPRKWLSNCAELLETIPPEDRASEINLESGAIPSVKTLGVLWIAAEDCFAFRLNVPDAPDEMTKRRFLQATASVFDPLGFVAPFLIRSKLCLQEMWLAGLDWDQALTPAISEMVQAWFDDFPAIGQIRIPRCLQEDVGGPARVAAMHVFSDASEKAYGAVAYLRVEKADGKVCCRLISSKVRVAPLAAVSIPRLELMAALVSVNLAAVTSKILELERNAITFWSDSCNVLHWVTNHSRSFKPFVAARVGEIQRLSRPNQWQHIPSALNPADLLSRGMAAKELTSSKLWWNGPSFLCAEQTTWPKQAWCQPKTSDLEERRADKTQEKRIGGESAHVTLADAPTEWALSPNRFSKWTHLLRITAWVYRFLNNCVGPKAERQAGELTVEEMEDAEVVIIRASQRVALPEYKNVQLGKPLQPDSKIKQLQPVMDDQGLLRVGGRLRHAEFLDHNQRNPVILPRDHHVTELIIKDQHEKGHHIQGVNHTLAELSLRYWIVSAREAIQSWEAKCLRCVRRKAQPGQQIMAPLPKVRVSLPLWAFARVSVDFARPFQTKQGRGRTRAKRYLCLFACHLSWAVHLELAYGLDVSSFLQAYHRFTNRRGPPLEVTSDNGTNFVGATNELAALVKAMDRQQIQRSVATQHTIWHFNPPAGPHFGGAHEALIKSAKQALCAILSKQDLTDEELTTAVTGAEALMNSRPLSYQQGSYKMQLRKFQTFSRPMIQNIISR